MKKRKYKTVLLVLVVCLFSQVSFAQQQDTTGLKFSEEALKKQKKRNMKWVDINPKRLKLDDIQSMVKVGVSTYSTISFDRIIDFEVGYQYKIKRTQLSVESKLRVPYRLYDEDDYQLSFPNRVIVGNEQIGQNVRADVNLDLIVRYQPFKINRINEQRSGDNLYGVYVFAGLLNALSWQKTTTAVFRNDITNRQPFRLTEGRRVSSGSAIGIFGIGFQQRILKKAYIDISGGLAYFSEQFLSRKRGFVQLGLGYSIFKVKK